MIVSVNDKPVEVAAGSNVEQLLQTMDIRSRGTAVAVNDKIVKRDNWSETTLCEGDSILIISAAYGG